MPDTKQSKKDEDKTGADQPKVLSSLEEFLSLAPKEIVLRIVKPINLKDILNLRLVSQTTKRNVDYKLDEVITAEEKVKLNISQRTPYPAYLALYKKYHAQKTEQQKITNELDTKPYVLFSEKDVKELKDIADKLPKNCTASQVAQRDDALQKYYRKEADIALTKLCGL